MAQLTLAAAPIEVERHDVESRRWIIATALERWLVASGFAEANGDGRQRSDARSEARSASSPAVYFGACCGGSFDPTPLSPLLLPPMIPVDSANRNHTTTARITNVQTDVPLPFASARQS